MSKGVRLLPPDEAADRLAVSRRHLTRLMSEGVIRIVRLGRSVRIPESEIERIAAQARPREGASA